tara:strand:+ start:192 stop:389 length:198 start_codon:yes stop_codon:yes gene_type:complete
MLKIIDDGTLDTVVLYSSQKGEDQEFRFSSEYRHSYASDSEFLEAAQQDIEETLAQHADLRETPQ